ncbi:MAG: hypothetical protein ACFN0W_04605 [Propionibacterium acidifaciens]|uniref:hypothetical protein n=1 Tax=Propionibacterium acidifaciens TaxID=556499 RepID=UPI0036092F50
MVTAPDLLLVDEPFSSLDGALGRGTPRAARGDHRRRAHRRRPGDARPRRGRGRLEPAAAPER